MLSRAPLEEILLFKLEGETNVKLNLSILFVFLGLNNCSQNLCCHHFCRNVVHGSDSPENGKREIGKFLLGFQIENMIFGYWSNVEVL